jgi:hypothetical protein
MSLKGVILILFFGALCFTGGLLIGAKRIFPYFKIRKTSDWIRAQVRTERDRQEKPIIVLQGDSLMARGDWSRLAGQEYSVINAGTGGARALTLDTQWVAETDKIDALVIWCGINDLAAGTSPQLVCDHLLAQAQFAQLRGIAVWVITAPDGHEMNPDLAASAKVLNAMLSQRLKEQGVGVVSCAEFYSGGKNTKIDSHDGLHFTVFYYERLAAGLKAVVSSQI